MAIAVALLARPASSQLITAPDPGQASPAGGGGDSRAPIISADGRYVLFSSTADNLVTNGGAPRFPSKLNVYLRDRAAHTTTLVSVNQAGTGGGNGDSVPVDLSTNGQYALFESSAPDLVPGDTNGAIDIFVRDLAHGTTILVSANTNGVPGNRASSDSVMTPDGRFVAFRSDARDLVVGDTNGIEDIFVRDLQIGATTLASVGALNKTTGLVVPGSEAPVISADGRYVAFYSAATNLVAGVTNASDIFIRDMVGATTTWASVYARAAARMVSSASNAICFNHVMSADGQYLAYEVYPKSGGGRGVVLRYGLLTGLTDVISTNALYRASTSDVIENIAMTPDGRFVAFLANTNGSPGTDNCVRLWDAQSGASILVSGTSSNTVPSGSACDWPVLDPTGRYVLFVSTATNIVTNAIAPGTHVYLRDTLAAVTYLVDADTNGAGSVDTLDTAPPQMSADARFVAFDCPDTNLVPDDRNHAVDVFVRDLVAGTNELISAHDASLPSVTANGSSTISSISISADGRFVAFLSDADNLCGNDTNNCRDVFVRDLLVGTNILVSVATNGAIGDLGSFDVSLSGNGRYVAFMSRADNLAPGDTNSAQDIFVRDLQAATTSLVSMNSSGSGSGNGDSYSPTVSTNGHYVLFHSTARNLTANALASGQEDLFVRDTQAGITYALTHTTSSTPLGVMTPDGRFVAFAGFNSAGTQGLFVWNSQTATIEYSNPTTNITQLGFSADGNKIAYGTSSGVTVLDRVANTNTLIGSAPASHAGLRFTADASWLAYAAGPIGGTNQVYLYSLPYGTNLLVSRNFGNSGTANKPSDSPEISGDGRFVAYRSAATDIVPDDTNGVPEVFLYDRLNNTTTLLSANATASAAANNRSLTPVFSGDGRTLIFQCWASDIVAGDFNQGSDLFAWNLGSTNQLPVFSVEVISGGSQGPWVTWPVVPGRNYQLQFKDALTDPAWQDASQQIAIVGSQAYLNDSSVGNGPRFYRVVAW